MSDNIPTIEQSADIAELAKALCAAQPEFGTAAKEEFNPHFKSDYAGYAQYHRAVVPQLNRHGVVVLQPMAAGRQSDGCIAYVATTLLHTSGQWMRSFYPVVAVKGDPQSFGAAVTYARRFGLAAMLALVAGDDDGEAAAGRGQESPSQYKATEKSPPPSPPADSPKDGRPSERDEEDRVLALIRSRKMGNDVLREAIDKADLPGATRDALDFVADAYACKQPGDIEAIAHKVGTKFASDAPLRDWTLGLMKSAFVELDKRGRAA